MMQPAVRAVRIDSKNYQLDMAMVVINATAKTAVGQIRRKIIAVVLGGGTETRPYAAI
jgi:hypothetical protein